MDPLVNIPFVPTLNSGINDIGIGNININPPGAFFIPNLTTNNPSIIHVADSRIWLQEPPQALPPTVPVTVKVGTPIVNMPGCVAIHKENVKRDPSRNKNLVNDDPKGNTVLCDAGMPYYNPADYRANELTWQTIYGEPPEVDGGVDTGDNDVAPPDTDTPEPPATPAETAEDVECPPLNARRIGDLNTAGTERVKEYKLTPDKKICETIWEPVPTMEMYLPAVPTITTTATIAAVATTSALLAKPLADLLLKVVKPVIKKAIGKVKALMGKKEPVLSRREKVLAQRERNRAVMDLRRSLKK
jgi:hypothetical protein